MLTVFKTNMLMSSVLISENTSCLKLKIHLYLFFTPKNYNISRNGKDNELNKTPSKPKRVSLSCQANDLFSLRQISKKFSTSMPELLDEDIVNKKNEHEWTNLISDKLSVKKRNNSVDSLQVSANNLVHNPNKQKM